MMQVVIRDLDPKAISTQELYGYVNMATREWKDGLLSYNMRELANVPDDNPKWILLDGDLDANWYSFLPSQSLSNADHKQHITSSSPGPVLLHDI